jgi:hypothetical protein
MRLFIPFGSFLKRNPFLFSLLLSGGGVSVSFFWTAAASCSSCLTQRLLWVFVTCCCVIGHFYRNKLMLFPVFFLSTLIGYLSAMKVSMTGLFQKSEVVLMASSIPQGLSCQTPRILKLSLPMWSFIGSLLVCVSTLFFIWLLSRKEKA